MIAHLLRTSPAALSAAGVVIGFVLIMSGYMPLAAVGAVMIVVAFFVPYLRLADRSTGNPTLESKEPNDERRLTDIETSQRDISRRIDELEAAASHPGETSTRATSEADETDTAALDGVATRYFSKEQLQRMTRRSENREDDEGSRSSAD